VVTDKVKRVANIRCHMTVLRLNSLSESSGNIALQVSHFSCQWSCSKDCSPFDGTG